MPEEMRTLGNLSPLIPRRQSLLTATATEFVLKGLIERNVLMESTGRKTKAAPRRECKGVSFGGGDDS
jgi:hypothetical protein